MQAFQISEPGFNERDRLFFGDRQRARQRLGRLRHFLLDRSGRGSVFVDVDFPTGQSRSQPGVLSFFSDGQRKLIFVHRDLHALLLRIEDEILHLGRLERFKDIFLRI